MEKLIYMMHHHNCKKNITAGNFPEVFKLFIHLKIVSHKMNLKCCVLVRFTISKVFR